VPFGTALGEVPPHLACCVDAKPRVAGCGYVYAARSAASIAVVVILAAVWLPWVIDAAGLCSP
jgi:hypothetical protein